jgi:polyphosphate:AMP phosphotransferase
MPRRKKDIGRMEYQARAALLREQLIQLQVQLQSAPFKVLLLIAGPEGSGRGDLLKTIASWLDPRGLETFSYHPPTDEERTHPLQWRFWRSLPPPGRIGLYAGSWYTETLREAARSRAAKKALLHEAERIRHFERLLTDDGTLVVKVWLDLPKKEQGERLRRLSADPRTAWRVTKEEWHHHRIHGRLAETAALIRRLTNHPGARWNLVDAARERARDLAVAELLLEKFRAHARVWRHHRKSVTPASVRSLRTGGLRRLQAVSLDQRLDEDEYESAREKWLGRLHHATQAALRQRRAVVYVFEGWDAAGKGGAIRRLTSAMDPRDYTVVAVGKPTHEEKMAHYLWRFWRQVPRDGRIAIFDRSWYGRVLVERIEGFCRPEEWRRAFREINEFERELSAHGIIVIKFWLHISHDEQLRRFRERETVAHKRHKINQEDWRNRRQRRAYEIAVGDMLALTDQPTDAPWHLIPSENKRFGRLEVLRAATRHLLAALERGRPSD